MVLWFNVDCSKHTFVFMEVLWYCRRLLKPSMKDCSPTEGTTEYEPHTIDTLKSLYRVQKLLFDIAGVTVERTVAFGALEKECVENADLYVHHPAYYKRSCWSWFGMPIWYPKLAAPLCKTEKERSIACPTSNT